jgi:hypothetical protein
MTVAQKEQERQMRMKAARENALFITAKQEEPGLTRAQHQADLFLQDLAAEEAERAAALAKPTASEHKATAGGRKTRRKRRRKRKKRGGYGPGITAEEARRMRIRDDRRREAERRQQIQQALAEEARVRRIIERREADTLRRANEIIPNRDITDLREARQIIDDHERHEGFMYNLIPVAKETGDVPHAIEAKRSLGSYILGSSKIPTADVVDEENIPMAVEAKMQRVGGKKTRKKKKRKRKRRKKHKKTRRK